jgi:hypothetical protein
VSVVAAGKVLIVSADARWLRVLEVTIGLGGATTISRRSLSEADQIRASDHELPTAMVIDLGAQASAAELDDVRALVREATIHAVVILPESLGSERQRLATGGATVLIRPYRPSELYAALWPDESGEVDPGADDPLTIDETADGSAAESAAEPADESPASQLPTT